MARHAWLTLARTVGALVCVAVCVSCGGSVVSGDSPDARTSTDVLPPQRGMTDGSVTAEDTATPPPPPVDAPVDIPRPVDVAPPIDRPPDIVTVVAAAPDVAVIRCAAGAPNCPDGTYCVTPNCGNNGTCQPVPADVQQAPVCGCDRLTYWNAGVAATNGTSVRGDGACPNVNAMSIACGGLAGANCPNGSMCNLEQASDATCNQTAAGRCWVLPATCPPLANPTTRRCVGGGGNQLCQSACDLIQAGRIFTVDPTCP